MSDYRPRLQSTGVNTRNKLTYTLAIATDKIAISDTHSSSVHIQTVKNLYEIVHCLRVVVERLNAFPVQ